MTDTPQPEYCDCPGYHDGSCSVRHIERLDKLCNDLHAALERTEHDRNLLAAEVQAWRHNDDVHECSLTTELEFLHKRSVKAHDRACEAAQRTDESGALQRAKEAK
jgi:hypothetical protein